MEKNKNSGYQLRMKYQIIIDTNLEEHLLRSCRGRRKGGRGCGAIVVIVVVLKCQHVSSTLWAYERQRDVDDIESNFQILSFPHGVGSLPPAFVQRQTRCSGSIAPQSGSAKTIPFQFCSERNKIFKAQSKSKYDTEFFLLNIVIHCLVNMHKLWKRFCVIVLDATPGNWYSSLLSLAWK